MAVTNMGSTPQKTSHIVTAIKEVADGHESLDDAVMCCVELAYRNDHFNYVAVASDLVGCTRRPTAYLTMAVELNIFWDINDCRFTDSGKYGCTIWIARVNMRRIRDKRWKDGMLTGDRAKMRQAAIAAVQRQVARRYRGLINLHDVHSKDAYRKLIESGNPFCGYVLDEWLLDNVDEIRYWIERDDNARKLALKIGLD